MVQIKLIFGTLGLLTAFMLWTPRTRRLGFLAAIVVTIAGRVYPQLTVKGADREHFEISVGVCVVAAVGTVMLS